MTTGAQAPNRVIQTAEQVRQEFRKAGVSPGGWARANGYPRAAVYGVLNGVLKGDYGMAHQIAVALGLKDGVIVDPKDFRPAPKAQSRKAAG